MSRKEKTEFAESFAKVLKLAFDIKRPEHCKPAPKPKHAKHGFNFAIGIVELGVGNVDI